MRSLHPGGEARRLVTSRAMIYHLAEQADWQQALAEGSYARSTRGRSLAEEGFIHASSDAQWPVVRRLFYADVTEPLVLLHVDESRLGARVVHEVGDPATGETFPHVYGPIEVDAVVGTTVLAPPHA
ncbi:DUF952 domain-containing protein [Terrabacter aeriphilus]|uniref:DUF952 domain-containing protein n=2 Tax=Terrabacter aeriphilus TaxID=515662 RepID=A0ABP9JA33_9MICO